MQIQTYIHKCVSVYVSVRYSNASCTSTWFLIPRRKCKEYLSSKTGKDFFFGFQILKIYSLKSLSVSMLICFIFYFKIGYFNFWVIKVQIFQLKKCLKSIEVQLLMPSVSCLELISRTKLTFTFLPFTFFLDKLKVELI